MEKKQIMKVRTFRMTDAEYSACKLAAKKKYKTASIPTRYILKMALGVKDAAK